MRLLTVRFGLALLLGTAALVGATPAVASCVLAAPTIQLGGFPAEAVTRPFYPIEEGQTATFDIIASGGCGTTMWVNYATSGGSATPNEDYVPIAGTDSFFLPDDDPMTHSFQVTVNSDPFEEPIVESAEVVLSNPQNASLGVPSSAPILIIDADGMSRVGFEGLPYSQSETYAQVRIPVFRAGDATNPSTVSYSVEPGPSNPATPSADYTATSPGSISFASGDRLETIDLSLANDELGEGPEDITVNLSGAGIGTPNSLTFTILDNEENVFPTSKFHHPRHNWKYPKTDYRIREIHVFATDEGGSGVVGADLALRRNLKSGACRWLTKEGWEKKECSNRQWLGMKYDDVGELFYYRHTKWKASVGTRIKNYTAFSRAIDGAGNVEKEFKEKRNANTFEVKRGKK